MPAAPKKKNNKKKKNANKSKESALPELGNGDVKPGADDEGDDEPDTPTTAVRGSNALRPSMAIQD